VGIVKEEVEKQCQASLTAQQVARLMRQLGFKWSPTANYKCYVETSGLTQLRLQYSIWNAAQLRSRSGMLSRLK